MAPRHFQKPGDLIVKIDGHSTENMPLKKVVEMVQGEPGTKVTLGLLHEGAKAPVDIEITRAQSQLFTARQDLLVAQTNILQQETILKNVISRAGVGTTELASVHIVPTDQISTDPRIALRVLEMTASETTERLGPHQYSGAVTFA